MVVWFFAFRPYVSTDDARVAEDLIRIAPDGVSGTVLKINVAEGDRVAQGQVLAELDHTIYQSQLLKAQARAILAQADFDRAERLYKQGGLSARDYQAAQSNAQAAQADLQLAQNALDHTFLKSPVDGIVVEKIAVGGEHPGIGPGGLDRGGRGPRLGGGQYPGNQRGRRQAGPAVRSTWTKGAT